MHAYFDVSAVRRHELFVNEGAIFADCAHRRIDTTFVPNLKKILVKYKASDEETTKVHLKMLVVFFFRVLKPIKFTVFEEIQKHT